MILTLFIFRRARFRYYYPGYAYHESFAYDYKKRFCGLEHLDWQEGWKLYVKP